MTNRRLTMKLAALALVALGGASPAEAAGWPERPINLIVPYPPGGLTDIVSRIVGEQLGKELNTPVVIQNRSGAGGKIGLQAMLQAPRDGYTFALVVPATMVTLPLTNEAYKIKPLEQFEPLTIAVDTFLTLVVDRRLDIKTLKDFSAYAKLNPGKLNYGTPGAGTSFHFNNVMMAQKLGIVAQHVPYTGEVQVLNDVTGGQLQYALVSNAGKTFIESGQVRALAVSAQQRVQSFSNVPTFKELGVDFSSDGWVGYVAAKGTPKPIVDKLQQAIVRAVSAPQVRTRLAEMGYQVVGNTPAEFRQIVQSSTERYAALLRSGAVKLD